MYAPLAAESVSPHPAGLALLEPQEDRLLSLIQVQTDEQNAAAGSQGTLTAACGRRNAAGVRRAISEFPGGPAGEHQRTGVRRGAAERARVPGPRSTPATCAPTTPYTRPWSPPGWPAARGC